MWFIILCFIVWGLVWTQGYFPHSYAVRYSMQTWNCLSVHFYNMQVMIALNPVVESSELIHITYTSAPRLPLLRALALTRSACYNTDSDRGFLRDMCVVLASHLLALLLPRQRSSTAGSSMSFPRSWQRTAGDSSRRKREICISPRCSPRTWAAMCAKWRTLWPTPGSWAHRRLWLSKQMVRYYTHFTHICTHTHTHTHSCSLNPHHLHSRTRLDAKHHSWWTELMNQYHDMKSLC